MLAYTKTIIPHGLDGKEITIEIDSNKSLPTIDIIGLADNSIKESRERLRASFRVCGIEIPPRKFVINLAPSDVKKSGTICDLAIATGLLLGILEGIPKKKQLLTNALLFGELGLDGKVKSTNGIFAAVIAGKKLGYKTVFVPRENMKEIAYIGGITAYAVESFRDILNLYLHGTIPELISHTNINNLIDDEQSEYSFDDVQGQEYAKRALAIAVAGMHNVLMIGSPGHGKSMLAKGLQSLLPSLGEEEMLEVSQMYSLVGKLSEESPLIRKRPFRYIHNTISKIALIGGGSNLHPGEISLAHKGILFLDEMPEFPRDLLDSLRQPLEEKRVHISRVSGNVSYPTECMIVGTMNPCICGFYGDPYHLCKCSLPAIKKYQNKISGPMLDRIDMILSIDTREQPLIQISTSILKAKVHNAQLAQQKRFLTYPYKTNSAIPPKDITTHIILDEESHKLLDETVRVQHYSLRTVHKIMRIARTIADFEGSESIKKVHLEEALQYKSDARMVKE